VQLRDATVSTHHANLVIAANGTTLRDLKSSNGTFVNGKRINEVEIYDGDEVFFGLCRTVWRSNVLHEEPLAR
jgi:adenylate cyclase